MATICDKALYAAELLTEVGCKSVKRKSARTRETETEIIMEECLLKMIKNVIEQR